MFPFFILLLPCESVMAEPLEKEPPAASPLNMEVPAAAASGYSSSAARSTNAASSFRLWARAANGLPPSLRTLVFVVLFPRYLNFVGSGSGYTAARSPGVASSSLLKFRASCPS